MKGGIRMLFVVEEKKAEELTENYWPAGFCTEGCDA